MSSHIPEKRAVNGEKGFSRGALSLVTSFGHAKEVTYKKSVLKKMGDIQYLHALDSNKTKHFIIGRVKKILFHRSLNYSHSSPFIVYYLMF